MTDRDLGDDLGFDPAVPSGAAEPDDASPPRARRSSSRPATKRAACSRSGRWRRRLGATAALLVALVGVGGVYAAFASASDTSEVAAATTEQDVAAGRSIYNTACITCHGANLQGVVGRGPSLVGTGQAAVYYQVSTGRMPVVAQGAQVDRKDPVFDDVQIEQLSAYIESIGGGPSIPTGDLRATDDDLGQGGQLFRLNCAQCHGFAGKGAPLSAGKYAPGLEESTDEQIYGAMLSGPENMPVFNDNQLTPDQKKMIISYIQTLKEQKDPGGAGIGRVGPVSEGLVIWIVGLGVIMAFILWIGRKTS